MGAAAGKTREAADKNPLPRVRAPLKGRREPACCRREKSVETGRRLGKAERTKRPAQSRRFECFTDDTCGVACPVICPDLRRARLSTGRSAFARSRGRAGRRTRDPGPPSADDPLRSTCCHRPDGRRPNLLRTPTDGSIRMCPMGRLAGNHVPLQIGHSDLQVTSQPDRTERMAARFIAR